MVKSKIFWKISIACVVLMLCAGVKAFYTTPKEFSVVNKCNCEISVNLDFADGEDSEVGSDMMINYHAPFCYKMYTIPTELIEYVGDKEFEKYLQSYNTNIVEKNYIPTSVEEAPGIYSFIQWFHISESRFRDLTKEMNQSVVLPDEYKFLDSDIEILYSKDIGAINKHFASEYCIVANGYIYTPEWILKHTAEEISAAGINKDMLMDKISYYESLPLSKNLRVELQKKMSQICEEDIRLDFSNVYKYYPFLAFEDVSITVSEREYNALEITKLNFEQCVECGISKEALLEILTKLDDYKDCNEYRIIQDFVKSYESVIK